MFETSMVLAHPRPRGRRVGLLTVSLIAHTAVIVGAVAFSVASVNFPKDAPNESAIFMPAGPPPPLGTPDGGAPKKPAAAPPVQKQEAAPPPTQIIAPPDVPDDVIPVDAPSSGDTGDGSEGLIPGPKGVPWGEEKGTGSIDAPPSPIVNAPPVEEKIYMPGGEVSAPVLLHRVEPGYPEILRKTGMSATVVVKCVIDRNGNIRDAEIARGAMQPFNDAVLKAITQWRYKPGAMRGQAVDTYLYVSVHFSIKR